MVRDGTGKPHLLTDDAVIGANASGGGRSVANVFSLGDLAESVNKLASPQILVLLDLCSLDAPLRQEELREAFGESASRCVLAWSADRPAYWESQGKITRLAGTLIDALRGAADADADGRILHRELIGYLESESQVGGTPDRKANLSVLGKQLDWAHDKGLEFICAAAPDVPAALCGDPGRLRQILLNLAGNALKFTRQGEIAVRASLVSETATDALLRFSVEDTGIGIPAEKQELLFQKFSQADVSTTRQFGGTGLGLAISKQLAEQMGGEIGVRSEVGKGTEFWFTVRLGKQAAGTRTAIPLATHLHGVRVLVVDDSATHRDVLLTQLTAWGLRPETAPDGPLALRALTRARAAGEPFRIALLDLQMPGMDGVALAQAIRADATQQATRLVLMITLSQRDNVPQRLEENGFAACLSKPVRQSELHDCLATVLAETDAPPEPAAAMATGSTEESPDKCH